MGKLPDFYQEERHQEIINLVQQSGRMSVSELSDYFKVSEVTIRLDLQTLAKRGLVVRTHGGAVPAGSGLYEHALTMRRERQVQEKNRIGERGAALVTDDDAIILDSSSTSLAVAQHLKSRRRLTIVTNGLALAQEMMDAPDVRVVVSGGTLHRDTASLVQTGGFEALERFNIQKGFFGATGFSLPEGLTDVSADEAEVKRQLAASCRKIIAVVDATKWGRVGLVSFARPEQIHTIITDARAPAQMIAQAQALGIEVIIV